MKKAIHKGQQAWLSYDTLYIDWIPQSNDTSVSGPSKNNINVGFFFRTRRGSTGGGDDLGRGGHVRSGRDYRGGRGGGSRQH